MVPCFGSLVCNFIKSLLSLFFVCCILSDKHENAFVSEWLTQPQAVLHFCCRNRQWSFFSGKTLCKDEYIPLGKKERCFPVRKSNRQGREPSDGYIVFSFPLHWAVVMDMQYVGDERGLVTVPPAPDRSFSLKTCCQQAALHPDTGGPAAVLLF